MQLIQAAAGLLLSVLLTACGGSNNNNPNFGSGDANPFAGYSSTVYSAESAWLCHPSLAAADNSCAGNLDATRVFADGSTEIELHSRAADPKVDCFYVYPTVSGDPGVNSDLEAGPEEVFATLSQAALYTRFCRVFAPIYRQVTIAALAQGLDAFASGEQAAYSDVLDSFKHYMANENNGRGVILVGHSQGAAHLERLVVETIETDDYLLRHLVSAHLLGIPIHTPEGSDLGDFQQVPVCRTADQTACVVNFSIYRVGDPDLAANRAFFGTPMDGAPAICTHPAALSGGSASLNAYFPVGSIPILGSLIIPRADGPFADPNTAPPITTPFYTMPDFISAECVRDNNGISYLSATAHADPDDPRADDFNGEFLIFPGWGLHLVDMTLALGDLVELGQSQAEAWLQDH